MFGVLDYLGNQVITIDARVDPLAVDLQDDVFFAQPRSIGGRVKLDSADDVLPVRNHRLQVEAVELVLVRSGQMAQTRQ